MLVGQVPIFTPISPRYRVAQLYSQEMGVLFVVSYYSQLYGGGIRTRAKIIDYKKTTAYNFTARADQQTPFLIFTSLRTQREYSCYLAPSCHYICNGRCFQSYFSNGWYEDCLVAVA